MTVVVTRSGVRPGADRPPSSRPRTGRLACWAPRLESALLGQPSELLSYIGVGLIEEAVKLATLWVLARRLSRYTVRDGMVLGAAVGFGFAALQSAGYAFTAFSSSSGLSLLTVVETEVLRNPGAFRQAGGCDLGRSLVRVRAGPTSRPRLTFARRWDM